MIKKKLMLHKKFFLPSMPEVLAHAFLSFHPVHNITTEVKDVRGNRDLNTSDSQHYNHNYTVAK